MAVRHTLGGAPPSGGWAPAGGWAPVPLPLSCPIGVEGQRCVTPDQPHPAVSLGNGLAPARPMTGAFLPRPGGRLCSFVSGGDCALWFHAEASSTGLLFRAGPFGTGPCHLPSHPPRRSRALGMAPSRAGGALTQTLPAVCAKKWPRARPGRTFALSRYRRRMRALEPPAPTMTTLAPSVRPGATGARHAPRATTP